jgi:HD-like signal output (HDOD) protein
MRENVLLKTAPNSKGIDRRLLGRLPAFSPIAIRLVSALADERTSYKDISRLIALDPVMAGEVLRLANSGLYGRRAEVRSVMTAIAMLGVGKISQIVMTAALWRGLPRRTSPFVRDWWRHSVAAALIARESGKGLAMDFAYTAALLHGVGQLALFEDGPRSYPDLVERACAGGFDLLAIEREEFGIDHAALAGVFLKSWGLPETLCDAVAEHHEDSAHEPLVVAVQTGCAGAEYIGFGRCGCHERLAAGAPGALSELFTDDYPLEMLVAEVNQIECSLG